MNKLYIILIVVLVIITTGIFIYWYNVPHIDYSCNAYSDCEIKNVGNYCGYYPLCVNINYQPHPPELKSNICGFPSIDGCECVENKCRGTFSGNP